MISKVTNITINNTQEYSSRDNELINSVELKRKFGLPEDYIELHTYDLNSILLKSNYNYTDYKSLLNSLPSSTNLLSDLTLDPSQDSINEGYDYGSTILTYNIFRNLFKSSPDNKFFIKDISTDRTELRVTNNNISNSNLEQSYNDFIVSFNAESFYKDFYLNLGNNNILIGVNVVLEQNLSQFNLLIKLYEPLSPEVNLKDQFWFVDKLSDSITYQVDFELEEDIETKNNYLRGPNFDIKINEEVNPSIDYINYNSILSSTSTSSYQQIRSLIEDKSLEINVDYSNYSEFAHFSSVKERLLNFVYKLKLIEDYQSDYNTLVNVISTPQISSSKAIITNNINNIVEKFDGYEYYLYFESGSKAWPKKNYTKPYINYEVTSSISTIWLGDDDGKSPYYGGEIYSSSFYDKDNQDNLSYSIPEYLRIDPQNKGYETFIHMIGQHFDNIWLYAKNITTLYDAQNNLNKGISKDLVSYALKSLGVKLYSNTSTTSDIFSYLLGVTPSGSYLPSTGSEVINTFVTSSNNSLLGSEIDKEIHKRIYHNLPYLLKTKGTERGLRALIACYGIPDTILKINEFGGSDKTSANYEQYFDRTSYGLSTKTGSLNMTTPWAPSYYQSITSSNSTIVPDTIEFRFKTHQNPPTNNFYSQSLFQVNSGSNTQFGVQLLYTSASNSGSYSDYADLRLVMSGSQGYIFSNPIHLPLFDGWWNVMVYRETGSLISSSISNNNKYWLYVANSIYNGHDGETVGYIGSSSLSIIGATSSSYNRAWNSYDKDNFIAYLGGTSNNNIISQGSTKFSGMIQELRYWATPLPLDNFKAHTLSPLSIECINETSSYSKLIFRLPLGSDLVTTAVPTMYSVHPSYSGSVASTGSFIMNSGIVSYGVATFPFPVVYGVAIYGSDIYGGINSGSNVSIVYIADTSFTYIKSGNMGLSKPTNDKIRIDNQEIASGSTLSLYTKIEQKHEIELTKDVNTLEIVFSPQDQINNDIIYQLGYFDIDEYIGDPREADSHRYSNLKTLREFYFKKYLNSYNLYDFVRLIKFYNNSLFKMIKDFVPARVNASTGILIKPHILERSKIKRNEPEVTEISHNNDIFSGVTTAVNSLGILEIYGESGNVLKSSSNYSFNEYIASISGSTLRARNNKWEIYTGEFGGSEIIVTDKDLQNNIYLNRSNSINLTDFNHSNYNILLNNISQSRTSTKHFKTDYGYQSIITNLELIKSRSLYSYASVQDSNYTSNKHILPRYLGSKNTSQLYNIFTEGDKSYGRTAAIDRYVRKIGLFTNITESRFLPERQEARLKYLVDENGDINELNLQNQNWFEIQNTFKAGDILVTSLFDSNKFSDQRSTNGTKSIFDSGYDYQPMLYLSSSDNTLYFQSTTDSNSKLFRFTNLNNAYISGSSSPLYPIIDGRIYNLFDQADSGYSDGNIYYTPGNYSTKTSASYTIPENNAYKFITTFDLTYTLNPIFGASGSFTCITTRSGSMNSTVISQSVSITSSLVPGFYKSFLPSGSVLTTIYSTPIYDIINFNTIYDIKLYGTGGIQVGTIVSGSNVYAYVGSTLILSGSGCQPFYDYSFSGSFILVHIIHTGSTPPSPGGPYNLPQVVFNSCSGSGLYYFGKGYLAGYEFPSGSRNSSTITSSLNLSPAIGSNTGVVRITNSSSYDTYLTGDTVMFDFLVNSFNTSNFTASISSGEQKNLIQVGSGVYPLANTSSGQFISGSTNGDTLIFNQSISNYINYEYVPFTGSNALYNKYGDIYYNFIISANDYIILYVTDPLIGTQQKYEYSVVNSYTSGSKEYVQLSNNLPNILNKGTYSKGDYDEFILLKRLQNETLVLLDFNKRPGQTSYGFTIPINLSPDVLDKINTITKEIKDKLIENQ